MASLAVNQKHVRMARSLPPRLLNFFMRYPPSTSAAPSPQIDSLAANTSSSDANANIPTAVEPEATPDSVISHTRTESDNPFLPFKNPITQKWQPAAVSLRKQAEIVKLAKKYNVISLLPYTPKLPEEVARRRAEHGLRVKGTGVGQKVKGKLWERQLKGKLSDRQKAMEAMPEMVRQWKERGHGRGWKKWPK